MIVTWDIQLTYDFGDHNKTVIITQLGDHVADSKLTQFGPKVNIYTDKLDKLYSKIYLVFIVLLLLLLLLKFGLNFVNLYQY